MSNCNTIKENTETYHPVTKAITTLIPSPMRAASRSEDGGKCSNFLPTYASTKIKKISTQKERRKFFLKCLQTKNLKQSTYQQLILISTGRMGLGRPFSFAKLLRFWWRGSFIISVSSYLKVKRLRKIFREIFKLILKQELIMEKCPFLKISKGYSEAI